MNDVLGAVIGRSHTNVAETAMCYIDLNELVCLEDDVFDSGSYDHGDNVVTYIYMNVDGEVCGLDRGEHAQVISDKDCRWGGTCDERETHGSCAPRRCYE